MESVNWIFEQEEVEIFLAYRFNQKVSPKGMKIREKYTRAVTCNWNHEAQEVIRAQKKLANKVYEVEYSSPPMESIDVRLASQFTGLAITSSLLDPLQRLFTKEIHEY